MLECFNQKPYIDKNTKLRQKLKKQVRESLFQANE